MRSCSLIQYFWQLQYFPFHADVVSAFNPARKLLKDRQDRIESDINTAIADKESAAALKAEYEGKLKDIDKEAEAILTEARQKALKTRTRLWMMQRKRLLAS